MGRPDRVKSDLNGQFTMTPQNPFVQGTLLQQSPDVVHC
jgi:hypothetical protein